MRDPVTVAVAPARRMDDYREALRVAAIPYVELAFERDAPDDVVRRAGGVLLLGGSDVDPALYGEAPHPTTEVVAAPRDTYEIALVRAAIARDLPVFAICPVKSLIGDYHPEEKKSAKAEPKSARKSKR